MTRPNDHPAPSPPAHYRQLPATTSRSASAPRIGTQPPVAATTRDAPSHPPRTGAPHLNAQNRTFRARAAYRAHAPFTPGTRMSVNGHPADSSRDTIRTPVLMPTHRYVAPTAVVYAAPT